MVHYRAEDWQGNGWQGNFLDEGTQENSFAIHSLANPDHPFAAVSEIYFAKTLPLRATFSVLGAQSRTLANIPESL